MTTNEFFEGRMTRKHFLYPGDSNSIHCSDCNRKPLNISEVVEHWYRRTFGEGVSGWTPEATVLWLCLECQVRALDLDWSKWQMRQLKNGMWIVEIALRAHAPKSSR